MNNWNLKKIIISSYKYLYQTASENFRKVDSYFRCYNKNPITDFVKIEFAVNLLILMLIVSVFHVYKKTDEKIRSKQEEG